MQIQTIIKRPRYLVTIAASTLLLLLISLFIALWMSFGPPHLWFQGPAEVPGLAADAVPDYTTHVAPILQHRCLVCHQDGAAQGNYSVSSYQAVMTSGNNAPNVIAGDLQSNLVKLITREITPVGGPMPPAATLTTEEQAILLRWIAAGAPAPVAELSALPESSGLPERSERSNIVTP